MQKYMRKRQHNRHNLRLCPDEGSSTQESLKKHVSSDSISASLQGDSNDEEGKEEGPTRLMSVSGKRVRSHSSLPSTQNRRGKLRKQAKKRLQKSMSCKTLGELELEEVKGFMDLGFVFKKENISSRMMSVIPGLQRLDIRPNEQSTQIIDASETGENHTMKPTEKKKDIERPYLSEAWLIKRPDSPLLNMKISKLRSASDMKKLLRFWAKGVASEIHHS
ncbi:uncharacterized protein LOC114732778 isoform X2 [Neltuma alba]|uniref:uncharacterized protein LOC114732778 isoform X2 n=1 Tax=Neltuma alba TaxID=207710 RepID=UPI0010A5683E|nr:uncharacterized protein LOC114732778 isoform X2 [Prosopis alba]